ncbi:MAG: hypothetical protein J5836_01890 [Clostridia bacterium]|nr:hypothetical protein [Clostridia bacterium]
MKFIKTKLSLLVIAAAFVLVGVLGIKPVSTARADGVDLTGFTMEVGASVKATADETKGYRGISWVTNVPKSFYTANGFDGTEQFGAIVAPTASFTGELTHATVLSNGAVLDIPNETAIDASTADKTYRTIVDYSTEIPEEKLAAAYAMELTCRAYVKVGETYYYAPSTGLNNSRSARQVAVEADNAGDLDAFDTTIKANIQSFYKTGSTGGINAKFSGYEGSYILPTSKGDMHPIIIDLEHPSEVINWVMVAANPSPEYTDICIGAQKLDASYSGGGTKTITINGVAGLDLEPGEQYLSVFCTNYVYRYPIIVASKVLTEISDFNMFKQIRNNYSTGKISPAQVTGTDHDVDLEDCKLDGYYVLGNNLPLTDYTEPVFGCQAGWGSAADFMTAGLGLTGTFNGLGHYIDGLTIGNNKYGGFFELISGGTVKNVAFTNLTNTNPSSTDSYNAILAYRTADPTFENIYIQASGLSWFYNFVLSYDMKLVNHSNTESYIKNVVLDITYGDGVNAPVSVRAGLHDPSAANSADYGIKVQTKKGRLQKEGGSKKSEAIICVTNLYQVSNLGAFYCYQNTKGNRYLNGYGENQRTAYIAGTGATDLNVGPAALNATAAALATNADIRVYSGYQYDTWDALASGGQSESIASEFTVAKTQGCFVTTTRTVESVDYNVPLWNNLPAA